MYTLSETYRRTPVTPAVLANALYRPSYLSGLWALGHYDLIPERVVRFTSVTSRVPRRFENPVGDDVSPFLERPQDAALLTRDNLEGLLGG